MKKNRWFWISGIIVGTFFAIGIFAPWLANDAGKPMIGPLVPFGPETVDIFNSDFLASPDSSHWMGTDHIGRDVFSRLVHALKNSLFFSTFVVFICAILGILLGGLMGFFGGWIDTLLSRFLELVSNFPIFLLQLTLLAFLPQNYTILLFVMVFSGWIPYCRFTRAEFLRLRNQDFVQAAHALGASKWRIYFKHLLPNSLTPSMVYLPFDISSTVTALGALSYLGFGEPINVASLGELLKQAKENFQEAWWLALYPGLALFLLTLSLSIFGSEIRDLLDPKRRRGQV